MNRQSLFDDIAREETRPQRQNEPQFAYLNASNRRPFATMRELIDSWYLAYPIEHRTDLRSRFRSDLNGTHIGAFFELLCHQLFRSLKLEVEVHPETDSRSPRRPDFLCRTDGGEEFYVESTLAAEPQELRLDPITKDVLDAADASFHPGFFLAVDITGTTDRPPRVSRIRNELRAWLNSLDYDAVKATVVDANDFKALPQKLVSLEGLELTVTALPRDEPADDEEDKSMIIIGPSSEGTTSFGTSIRRAIKAKGTAYGNLGKPFIVAINAMAGAVGDEEVKRALIGSDVYTFRRDSEGRRFGNTTVTRRTGGAWISSGGPTYTRISGVLVVDGAVPWSVSSVKCRLWQHPFAQRLAPPALDLFPAAKPVDGRFELSDGTSIGEILRLRSDWPGED